MSSVSLSSSSTRLPTSHYMNPMLTQFRKRVQLKRPTQPVLPKQIQQQQTTEKKNKSKKSVRFHQEDQVRYFLKCQSPSAVREGDPPEDAVSANDFDLALPNWPKRRLYINNGEGSKIRMESLALTEGDAKDIKENKILLEGRCRALNISYEKVVSVRYTFDLWSTFEEINAVYRDSIPFYGGQSWDRFSFYIPVNPEQQSKTIYIALRYSVDNAEYWDNNDGMNYQVCISRKYQEPVESDQEEDEQDEQVEEYNTDEIVNTFNELDLKNNTNNNNNTIDSIATTPSATSNSKLPLKVLGRRYDFTASLNAVRKPTTSSPPLSPPVTPTDLDPSPYTPPVFFGGFSSVNYMSQYNNTDINTNTNVIEQPASPPSTPPVSIPVKSPATAVQQQEPMDDPFLITSPFSSAISTAEGCRDQMSYSDFINKYCFYNSHANPLYNNVYSTSPSAVLS